MADRRVGDAAMIGWVCAYTPEEIFTALGLESSRLCGDCRGSYPRADLEYLPVNFCPYGRTCLNEGLAGEGRRFTGFVLAASCHAMVHLANAFSSAADRLERGAFVHLLDLPRLTSGAEAAVEAFASSLRSLVRALERRYGVVWDEDAFWKAVSIHRRLRQLLRQLYELRKAKPEAVRAAGLLDAVRAVCMAPRKDEALPVLESVIRALEGGSASGAGAEAPEAAALLDGLRRNSSGGGPRLVVSGAPLPPSYLDLVEELGGSIVGDDLCHGYRYTLPEVEEGGDPFVALGRGYLGRVPCPRMLRGRERFEQLLSMAKGAGAKGIIYHSLKFCDSTLYEYSLFREYADEAGMPLLYLETEYREAGLEQGRTRIQAFLEMLS
ncbi:MAG: 2-hydroxyacyl-CoA dehydratase subunit D [Thermacetogeniaceae bacterium]